MYWNGFIPEEPFLCLGEIPRNNETGEVIDDDDIPAWSLSALLALCPKNICDHGIGKPYYLSLAKEFPLSYHYGATYVSCWDYGDAIIRKRDINPIEAIVQLLEWLTANGYKLIAPPAMGKGE